MDSPEAVLRSLIKAWERKRWPPQDVADLMSELSKLVERARALVGTE
jgi:hypothetical protein